MENEIKEMGKFACTVCEHCGTDEKGGFRCGAGINQDVCGLCQDLGKALYDVGYRKTAIFKNDNVTSSGPITHGDKIRSMNNEELAKQFVMVDWDYSNDSGFKAVARLTKNVFFQCDFRDFVERAVQDNVKYLNSKTAM